jgi:transposase
MAFHPIDRDTDFLLPPSVQEWLPEAHLARYVVEVVEQLDLSVLERAYAGNGSTAYHPATLLSLLIYGYATATFSSRKIERATYDSLAFRFIACNRHPDHDTLANFRKRFGAEFQSGLCAGTADCTREPVGQIWHGQPGRDQDPCQRQSAQRFVLWSCGEDRGPDQGRSEELMKLAEAADQSLAAGRREAT